MSENMMLMAIHMVLMAMLGTAWFYIGRTWGADRSDRSDRRGSGKGR